MRLFEIDEPELEFGLGKAVCPRYGISQYQVYDTKFKARRDKIYVGAVGTSEGIDKLRVWLTRCSKPIPAKLENKQPRLFPAFTGFNQDQGFKASTVIEDEITRSLNNSDIKRITGISDWNERIDTAVNLFYEQVKFLSQNKVVDVIVCVLPISLYDSIAKQTVSAEDADEKIGETTDQIESNFRRALKAKAMHLGKPLQLIREYSLEPHAKGQQDDATKAWNFSTALYYKANQTVPWRLPPNPNRPLVCYAGVGFYRSRDKKILRTSLAQIFNELGKGVILRGTPVEEDKKDRQPHLNEEQSYNLLRQALDEYKIALGNLPGRLVLHKTSNYNEAELSGFRNAAYDSQIGTTDFITIMDTTFRLLRYGQYPPYRGTHIELDRATHLLYTRGSVDYYQTYPGKYIPQPLEIRIAEADESPSVICNEILGLSKMNWNNTRFDGKYPITIECARRVGEIMKYLKPNDHPQISYSFYM